MQSVFWATFINTGIILLMTNGELRYSVLKFLPLHGQYPDFDQNWYGEIGPQLTQTMMIMAFYPYMEMFIFGGIRKLQQALDKGCACWEKYKTKKTTTLQYTNLYGGPMYLMHFKYSSILTQVYISFMYGLFVPVLFPIATIGIMNMYLVEKFALLYYYRKPPMYDEKLQKESIRLLKNAPVAMFLLGYWAMGNNQIFFGRITFKTHANSVSDPRHQLVTTGAGLSQTHWCLVIIFCLFVKKFIIDTIGNCIKMCAKRCCEVEWEQDVLGEDVEEKIGNYWESMTGDDQKIWYASEVYYNFRFGITSVSEEAQQFLRTKDRRKALKDAKKRGEGRLKYMEDESRYDILANVTY